MATWGLVNSVSLLGANGPSVLRPGEVVDDSTPVYGQVIAAGGELWPTSDGFIATALLRVSRARRRSANDVELESIMRSATVQSVKAAFVGVFSAATPGALTARECVVAGSPLATGSPGWVSAPMRARYVFDATSTQALDAVGFTVLAATVSGIVTGGSTPGRWKRDLSYFDAEAALVAAWHVNESTGSNANDGLTAGTALHDLQELVRRVGWGSLTSTLARVDVWVHGATLTDVPLEFSVARPATGTLIVVHGEKTVVRSGTLSVVSDPVGTEWVKVTDPLVSSWVADVGRRIELLDASGNLTVGHVALDRGGGVAFVTRPGAYLPDQNPLAVLVYGTFIAGAYQVTTTTNITGSPLKLAASSTSYVGSAPFAYSGLVVFEDFTIDSVEQGDNTALIHCSVLGSYAATSDFPNVGGCYFGAGSGFTVGKNVETLNASLCGWVNCTMAIAGHVFWDDFALILDVSWDYSGGTTAYLDFHDGHVGLYSTTSATPLILENGSTLNFDNACSVHGSGPFSRAIHLGAGCNVRDLSGAWSVTGTGGGYQDVELGLPNGGARSTLFALDPVTNVSDAGSHALTYANLHGATFHGSARDVSTGAAWLTP